MEQLRTRQCWRSFSSCVKSRLGATRCETSFIHAPGPQHRATLTSRRSSCLSTAERLAPVCMCVYASVEARAMSTLSVHVRVLAPVRVRRHLRVGLYAHSQRCVSAFAVDVSPEVYMACANVYACECALARQRACALARLCACSSHRSCLRAQSKCVQESAGACGESATKEDEPRLAALSCAGVRTRTRKLLRECALGCALAHSASPFAEAVSKRARALRSGGRALR
eukprot:6179515-Pleurochrysis_carterae.AAC.6